MEIALDPSDYNDPSEDVQEVMDQYISQVFLADENTEDSDSDTQVQLENNTEEEHADFNQSFIDELKKMNLMLTLLQMVSYKKQLKHLKRRIRKKQMLNIPWPP